MLVIPDKKDGSPVLRIQAEDFDEWTDLQKIHWQIPDMEVESPEVSKHGRQLAYLEVVRRQLVVPVHCRRI